MAYITNRWVASTALTLGLLLSAPWLADAAPIKFDITDLGKPPGTGLDNDGNVIDQPIRNITGESPYKSEDWGTTYDVIDGTRDGRLLMVRYALRSHDPESFVYNPHGAAPKDGPEIPLGGIDTKESFGIDMNAKGDVVGLAEWGGIVGRRPFYAASDSLRQLQDLNDLIPIGSGWKLTDVYSINDHGQILAGGENFEGQRSALLLTPVDQVPEPATWAVFGLAAAAFAWRKRRAA